MDLIVRARILDLDTDGRVCLAVRIKKVHGKETLSQKTKISIAIFLIKYTS